MIISNWLELLKRQTISPITWDEIVVGYDFGILGPADIQAWASTQIPGPLCRQLVALANEHLVCFEEALWAAATEATGRVPRPGGQRWAAAQDRWRLALLKDALEAQLSPEALAIIVESIYERVGCPEDMLHLWKRANAWGLHDMLGNVSEWTADNYDATGQFKALRGGDWFSNPRDIRASAQFRDEPTFRNKLIGFRCAVLR